MVWETAIAYMIYDGAMTISKWGANFLRQSRLFVTSLVVYDVREETLQIDEQVMSSSWWCKSKLVGKMIKTKVIDLDEFTTLLLTNFLFEIIYYIKILFEVLKFQKFKF